MTPQELYEIWAPRGGRWTPWVKPVLFFHMPSVEMPTGLPDPITPWAPDNNGETAIVIDLPGEAAISHALVCAHLGFRLVPLYNSCPGHGELVSLTSLAEALFQAGKNIADLSLPLDAPPVFLLDSRRMDGIPVPNRFDNRWMVFPQDFPSAAKLKSAGITTVLLVQKDEHQPPQDLAHVVAAWQESGLKILVDSINDTLDPRPITIRKPFFFRSILYRMQALFGLRKNSAGGFGSVIPLPTESSGFG